MRFRFLLFLLGVCIAAQLQAGSSFIFLADTTKLFYGNNNEIYAPDARQLLFFQKGNIFFSGTSDDRQSIYLLTTAMNFASPRLELIYEKDNREASYSFSNSKFYAGQIESDDLRAKSELIHVDRIKK